jgi:hypothetical protein
MSPTDAVRAAQEDLSGYRSARMTMDISLMPSSAGLDKGGAAAQSTEVKGSGLIGRQPAGEDVNLQMDDFTSKDGPTALHLRFVDGDVYMDIEGTSTPKAMEGIRWVSMTAGDMTQLMGGALVAGGSTGDGFDSAVDPAAQVSLMLGAPTITDEGKETADGVQTEYYESNLTLTQVEKAIASHASEVPPADRQQVADSLKKSGLQDEHLGVWIGSGGSLVKTKITLTTALRTSIFAYDYAHWSPKPAGIEAPARGQTMPYQEALEKSGVS